MIQAGQVDKKQIMTAALKFQKVFRESDLNALGKKIGLCVRQRAITPFRMAFSLVTSLACKAVESLADLQRDFNALTGANIGYKAFYNQLAKGEFPAMMLSMVSLAIKEMSLNVLELREGSPFRRFKQILIHDGSSFALKDALQDIFPGRFSAVSPAAVELHTTMDLLSDAAVRIVLAPDTESEQAHLPDAGRLKDCLFLGDRGYVNLSYMHEVDQNGGSFIIRGKEGMNPWILDAWCEDGQRPDPDSCPFGKRARREFFCTGGWLRDTAGHAGAEPQQAVRLMQLGGSSCLRTWLSPDSCDGHRATVSERFGGADRPRAITLGNGPKSVGIEVFSEVPWKPALRRPGDCRGVAQELGQIVERVLPCELAGMDQAQKHIPNVGTVFRLEEIGILPVEDSAFQRTLADVVIQRSLGNSQKAGELLPVLEQVLNGLADPRAGLDELFGDLLLTPALEFLHDGGAFFLVESEALIGIELEVPGQVVVMIDFAEGFDHMPALFREMVHDIDEVPAGVGEAVGDNRLKRTGDIAA